MLGGTGQGFLGAGRVDKSRRIKANAEDGGVLVSPVGDTGWGWHTKTLWEWETFLGLSSTAKPCRNFLNKASMLIGTQGSQGLIQQGIRPRNDPVAGSPYEDSLPWQKGNWFRIQQVYSAPDPYLLRCLTWAWWIMLSFIVSWITQHWIYFFLSVNTVLLLRRESLFKLPSLRN